MPSNVLSTRVRCGATRRAACKLFLVHAALATCVGAQEPPAKAEKTTPELRRDLSALTGIELRYPRDKDKAVAKVDEREITLGEMARYMDEHLSPGFAGFLATPAGNLYFDKRQPADWIRQYADIVALQAEARAREVPQEAVDARLEQAAEGGFEAWLAHYRQQREDQGVKSDLTDERKANLRARHRREFGLADQRQGWLDALTPDLDRIGLDAAHYFYRENPRYFGGVVHLAHILVYDRQPVSGQLLVDADRRETTRLLAEVKARLAPDGSNFEDVARLMSEDRRTANRGGILRNVSRFDPRLPPSVTRAAWELRDGEWTGPIESPYGQHFVKRLSYTHYAFFLVTESTLPKVRDIMRRKMQEDAMLDIRRRHRVTLLY
ncbi:MAG: peptidylprolyl isomerase [Planctomycetota bacterium]